MKTLYRIWQNAVGEWTDAIRSRRALVLLLLYLQTGKYIGCQILGQRPEYNHHLLRIQLFYEGSDVHFIHLYQDCLRIPVALL